MFNYRIFLSLLLLFSHSVWANSDCIDRAAKCFQINPLLIKSIIWQESHFKENATHINDNGTQDIGLMQINSIHLPALTKLGLSAAELKNNRCANVFSGAKILHDIINRDGYSWDAIGKYHSATLSYKNAYLTSLIHIIKDRTLTQQLRNTHIEMTTPEKIDKIFLPLCNK